MIKIFVDTNIPMYWGGTPSPHKESCKLILELIAREEIYGITDTEVFQEILYRYSLIKEAGKGWRIFDFFKEIITEVLPVSKEDIYFCRKLSEKYKKAEPRDLLHLAVMLNHDLDTICSTDKDFDGFKEIKRLDPIKLAEFLSNL